MHKSRLAALVIDSKTDDLDRDAAFRARALGREVRSSNKPEDKGYNADYRSLPDTWRQRS